MMVTDAVRVLLVEDDADDERLFHRYVQQLEWPVDVHAVSDGDKALAWLQVHTPLPDLIVLDLNLPRLSGRQVLHRLTNDPVWSAIPVAVVTGADWDRERRICQSFGAGWYLCKPYTAGDLSRVFRKLRSKYSTLYGSGVRRAVT